MTGRHRDIAAQGDHVQGIIAQQISSASSDVNGTSIDLQSYNMPQSGTVIVDLNSANSTDDFAFQVQESADDSSWSDISDAAVTGLDDTTSTGTIDLSNLQDQSRYIRVIMDSANSSMASANVEISAKVFLFGAKTV